MTSLSSRFDKLVFLDCAALCGNLLPPSSQVARFGKTRSEIETALARALQAYNSRFKVRTGLSGTVFLIGAVCVLPMLLLFVGGMLMNFLAWIGAPIPSFDTLRDEHPFLEPVITWVGLAGIPIIALASRLTAKATTVLSLDPRPPVLLLRSFADEARAPKAHDSWSWGVVSILEEKLGLVLGAVGPFIAIGVPGERIADRGAGRAYYSEAEWQGAVLKFMETSRCIILIAGDSPALVWELEQIAARDYLSKTVIVLPPDTPAFNRARWQILEKLLPPLAHASAGSADETAAIYHVLDQTVLVGSSIGITVANYGDMMRAPLYDLFCVQQHA